MTRLANETDFKFIYECYMHPQVNPFLLYEKMSLEDFRPIYDSLLKLQVKYIYSSGLEKAGMFKLIPLQYRSDHIVYLGGPAIAPSFSGKGEGSKMLGKIIALAKEKGFLRIELSVASTNEKAIQLYEKLGFEREGLLRKYTHLKSEQRFMDEIMMSLLF